MRAFVAMRNYIMTTTTVTAELAEIRARLALLEQTGKDNAEAVSDLSVWFGSRLSLNLCVKTPERIIISKARVPDFKRWFVGV